MKKIELDFKKMVQENLAYIVSKREYLHRHPELSDQEFNTCKVIHDDLVQLGVIDVQYIAKTGVTGLIQGALPGPVILLRADIDALSIEEKTDVPYRSQNKGVMHACGHDGHTAALLGVVKILTEHTDQLKGTIRLAFQPAEEGDGGAKRMIEEGILNSPKVDYAMAFHVNGLLPEGTIGIKAGGVWYSCDDLVIKLYGKGGHSSLPQLCVNPILLAIEFIEKINNRLSQQDHLKDNILAFCQFNGGNACNIIPNEVELKGTLRTCQQEARQEILEMIESCLKEATAKPDASYQLNDYFFAPVCLNDNLLTQQMTALLQHYYTEKDIVILEKTMVGAEDFAFFSQKVPSFYFLAGIRQDKEMLLHSPDFQWRSEALQYPVLAILNMVFHLTEFTK